MCFYCWLYSPHSNRNSLILSSGVVSASQPSSVIAAVAPSVSLTSSTSSTSTVPSYRTQYRSKYLQEKEEAEEARLAAEEEEGNEASKVAAAETTEDKKEGERLHCRFSVWSLKLILSSGWINVSPENVCLILQKCFRNFCFLEKEDPSQKSAAIRAKKKRDSRRSTGRITLDGLQVSEVFTYFTYSFCLCWLF